MCELMIQTRGQSLFKAAWGLVLLLALTAAKGGVATALSEPTNPVPAVIVVDTTETPELNDYGQTVELLAAKWYPIIVARLPSDGYQAPTHVKIVFQHIDGIAYTTGSTITCADKWFTQ